jgi:hypothetical protein
MRRKLAAVSIALVLVAGCGKDDSKAAYLKRAEAVCTKRDRLLPAVPSGPPPPGPPRPLPAVKQEDLPVWAAFYDRATAVRRGTVQQLRRIQIAKPTRPWLRQVLDRQDAYLASLSNVSAAAHAGDLDAFNAAVTRSHTIYQDAYSASTRFGFRACTSHLGRAPSAPTRRG